MRGRERSEFEGAIRGVDSTIEERAIEIEIAEPEIEMRERRARARARAFAARCDIC